MLKIEKFTDVCMAGGMHYGEGSIVDIMPYRMSMFVLIQGSSIFLFF